MGNLRRRLRFRAVSVCNFPATGRNRSVRAQRVEFENPAIAVQSVRVYMDLFRYCFHKLFGSSRVRVLGKGVDFGSRGSRSIRFTTAVAPRHSRCRRMPLVAENLRSFPPAISASGRAKFRRSSTSCTTSDGPKPVQTRVQTAERPT